MKNSKGSVITFLIVILAVLFLVAVVFKNRSGGLVGSQAPPIQLSEWITSPPPDLTGRVYVLEFWATWCPPCVQSIPHMVELANKYRDKAVPFISISVDRSSEPVKKMVASKGMTYHIGMDNGLSDKFSVSGIPSAFIVGRSGKIVWQGHPMSSDFEPALIKAINAAPPAAPDAK
ncbi:MAG: TlpA family protein disulfide reductase [Sedimentisphaerales bacterium]|nr:TlpA family protein disulfide reductase [Sedimentisphaerales bacterium]